MNGALSSACFCFRPQPALTMYDTGCFSTNGFYPAASSCSSNASSPDSLKHQRLLITATPSPPSVSQHFFPQQQYLFDQHRFHVNHNNNNNNHTTKNTHKNNSNLNGASDLHPPLVSSTASQEQLSLWLASQSSVQPPQQQSRFSSDLCLLLMRWISFCVSSEMILFECQPRKQEGFLLFFFSFFFFCCWDRIERKNERVQLLC